MRLCGEVAHSYKREKNDMTNKYLSITLRHGTAHKKSPFFKKRETFCLCFEKKWLIILIIDFSK